MTRFEEFLARLDEWADSPAAWKFLGRLKRPALIVELLAVAAFAAFLAVVVTAGCRWLGN